MLNFYLALYDQLCQLIHIDLYSIKITEAYIFKYYLVIDSAPVSITQKLHTLESQFNNGCPKFNVILKLFVTFSTKYQAWN